MRIALLIGIVSLAAGCARNPAADRPPAVTTSANTAVAMAGGSTQAATPGDQGEAVDQALVKRGYQPRRIHGQLRYCLSQTLTGSHFNDTVCLTSAQIKADDQNTRRDLERMNGANATRCPNNKCS